VLTRSNFYKRTGSSDSSLNKNNYHVNHDIELVLGRRRKSPSKKISPEVRYMLAVSLVFGSFLTILFLVVGLVIGWTAREYMMNYREVPRPHPEMFDNQGNLIPDEVIAFNFENYHDDSEESSDDGNNE
tara:strand:- start:299 stop:685 length:387 start_codon:yes stop_codon:yes gene_type:complete